MTAVPESRLVTSVLLLKQYVRGGDQVLNQASPFFSFNAPEFWSTKVSETLSLGNRPLQLPFLSRQPFPIPLDLEHCLCLLERYAISSHSCLYFNSQFFYFIQLTQSVSLHVHFKAGGQVGNVRVGSL